MTVSVLIREDQNEHGYIDSSIVGVFSKMQAAHAREGLEWQRAREEGLAIEDDESEGDWQVCWRIEAHEIAEGPFDHFLDTGLAGREAALTPARS